MNNIDLASLSGISLKARLEQYIGSRHALERDYHIVCPEVLGRVRQRGESCKLVALAEAIDQAAFKALKRPVQPYKDKTASISLRQLAKAQGSVVGEMYSLESLLKTSSAAGFDAAYLAPGNEEEYIRQLELVVDNNLAAMVFFDMDYTPGKPHHGFPYMGDGKNEHCATVAAYYKTESGATRFIVTYWNRFFDFDGMELATSSLRSLVDKREVETFSKVKAADGSTKWVLKEDAPSHGPLVPGVPERTAVPMKDGDTSLKGKIMFVTGPSAVKPSYASFFPAVEVAPTTAPTTAPTPTAPTFDAGSLLMYTF